MESELTIKDHIPPIVIGYYDPFNTHPILDKQLSEKISLTNLHWRKNTNDPLRSITQLQVSLEEELPRQFDNNSDEALGSLKASIPRDRWMHIINQAITTPFVRLMFVQCKSIDEYRAQVRPLIEVWLKDNIIKSNSPLEWFIILYSNSANEVKLQTRILEKIRTDFNYGMTNQKPSNSVGASTKLTLLSSDRIIQVKETYDSVQEDNETWNKLNSKLKAAVLGAFQPRMEIIDSLIKDGNFNNDSQQKFTGDNFNILFALKEAIAHLHLKLRLFEDALAEYDILSKSIQAQQEELFEETTWTPQSVHPFPEFIEATSIWNISSTSSSSSSSRTTDQLPGLFQLKTYLFAKQFMILEGLSTSATSLSLQSIHISELLRRLPLFIAELSSLFHGVQDDDDDGKESQEGGDNLAKLEWTYMLIDFIIDTDSCRRIIATQPTTVDENDPKAAPVNEIFEKFGELAMLQRTLFVDMGKHQNFQARIPNSIVIINNDNNNNSQTASNTTGESVSSCYEIKYQPLIECLQTVETFESQYVKLTEEAIKYFNASHRPRSVDTLSIDIALLDFQNKRYEKAVTVLSSCPSFYCSQGWDFIGFSLMGALIECLENIEDDSSFFNNGGSESLNKQSTLAKYYLDYISLVSSNPQFEDTSGVAVDVILEKLNKLKGIKDVVYPMNSLFQITPDKELVASTNDIFDLNLKWENRIPGDIKSPFQLQDVSLYLRKEEDEDETMVFSKEMVLIDSKTISMTLQSSTVFIDQEFTIEKLTAKLNDVWLVYEFTDKNANITFPPLSPATVTSFSIGHSTAISLAQKSISLFIKTSHHSKIQNINVHFSEKSNKNIRFTNGITVTPTNISLDQESIENPNQATNKEIRIIEIPSNTLAEVRIPYEVVNSTKASILSLNATIQYTINDTVKTHSVHRELDTALPIAVSVQDIFKSNGLYAKFTIGSVDFSNPVTLIDVDLEANEKFKVIRPMKSNEIVALKDQLCLYFFKIVKKSDSVKLFSEEFLKLDVKFRNLRDEMVFHLENELMKHLEVEGLQRYIKFFKLQDTIKFDPEKYATSKIISVVNNPQFSSTLSSVTDDKNRAQLMRILKEVINKPFPIPPNFNTQQFDRHLSINVQIPVIDVIHEVNLNIDSSFCSSSSSVQPKHYTIGEDIQADLEIVSHINKIHPVPLSKEETEKKSRRKVLFQDEIEQDLDDSKDISKIYQVEIFSNNNSNQDSSWIINGLNKFTIEIKPTLATTTEDEEEQGEEQESYTVKHDLIPLSLTPLKTGKLSLPKIKITRVQIKSKEGGRHNNGIKDSFQVDYKDENGSIFILSGNNY